MERIKKCPFCKGEGKLNKDPLWNGSHGYHGSYEFYVACSNQNCLVKPRTRAYGTIYENNEELQANKAVNAWNNRDGK